MLKYVDTQVVFQEIPDEITLAINISGCKQGCKNCHSPYLAEDIGEDLTVSVLSQLIYKNKGITCVCFMGGDSDPFEVNILAKSVKDNTNLKTAWYSGKQEISTEIDTKNFNYIKVGPYIEEKGPLNNSNTNQIMFEFVGDHIYDITYKFWKNDTSSSL